MGEDGKDHQPPEGFEGNLTDDQQKKVKEIWKKYFEVVKSGGKGEIAGVKADANADDDEGKDEGDGEDAFKGKAKDDAGKEEQAKQREKKELAAMIGQHGADKFREEFWNAARGETPDALMLRFLRARKWDVDRAFAMLAAALKWRIDQGVQEIKEKGEEGMCEEEGFRLQYDVGKAYINGTDNHDRPVVYIHVAKHHPKDQSQKALQRFTIFNMETARQLLTPRSNGQGTLVFDMTNFGLSNMDWSCIKFIMECFEARYPETLGLCLVHKAPMVFNAIWTILKPLLDPVVRSKIDFTKNEADLAKHIPAEHIKKAMGGDLDWEWSYSGPAKGENDRMKDSDKKAKVEAWDKAVKEWEDLTETWIDGDSAAGKERDERHAAILMIRHLDMDPYVRGQTVYSRNGTNVGDGTVRWQYPDGDEEFGTSFDNVRKDLGIEGKCPKNGHAGGPVAAKQQELDATKDPEEAAAFAAGKQGGGRIGKLKRRASNSFSVLTPGKSEAAKAKEDAQNQRDRLQKELEKAKEEEKKQEEERKKQEKEKAAKEAEQQSGGGILGTVAGAATATANYASNYIPAAIGGQKLKEMTEPAGKVDNKEASAE